jgi:hypothetical protein
MLSALRDELTSSRLTLQDDEDYLSSFAPRKVMAADSAVAPTFELSIPTFQYRGSSNTVFYEIRCKVIRGDMNKTDIVRDCVTYFGRALSFQMITTLGAHERLAPHAASFRSRFFVYEDNSFW